MITLIFLLNSLHEICHIALKIQTNKMKIKEKFDVKRSVTL